MRFALAIAAVLTASACDFQPGAPKRVAPEPVAEPGTANPSIPAMPISVPGRDAAAEPAPPPVDAGMPIVAAADDATPERSAPCIEAGVHYAQLVIDHTADPQTKAQYLQDRSRMVKSTADTCTKSGWMATQIACMTAATTPETARDCVRPPHPTTPTAPPPDDHFKQH